MTEPLQQGHSADAIPVPDATNLPGGDTFLASAVVTELVTDIGVKLLDEMKSSPAIIEDKLRPIRDKLYDRQEVHNLKEIADLPVDVRIDRYAAVSQIFLHDAETECAMPSIDLPKVRMQIHIGYSYAKLLSEGKYKSPVALNALKAWQVSVTKKHPEAVRQLVETYKQTIDAEIANEKPDLGWINQWINLCTGFAPELAAGLAEKYLDAIQKRCEFFVAKVEAEFAKEAPDRGVIESNIIVPPKYYDQLRPGSTMPARMEELQQRYDALKKK